MVTQADKIRGGWELMVVEKAKMQNEMRMAKKEMEIDNMSPDEVLNELKVKKIPTFGTPAERKDRLKRALGIRAEGGPGGPASNPASGPAPAPVPVPVPVPAQAPVPVSAPAFAPASGQAAAGGGGGAS